MDIELLKKLKKLQKLTNEELSQRSGVPVGTLNKIFSGATKSPKHDTVQAIADVLKANHYETDNRTDTSLLREAFVYDVTRSYTVEDYYAFPEDVRVELMEGSLFFMEAPDAIHQAILGELYFIIKSFIKRNNGRCRVLLSPFDVKLDMRTILQPDLMIVCDKEKIDHKACNGAPDYVAEIVSNSSIKLDYIKKLNKYMDAGVREYWIIDPGKRVITVYRFEEDASPIHYSFSEQIPLSIYQDLVIDFKDIEAEIAELRSE